MKTNRRILFFAIAVLGLMALLTGFPLEAITAGYISVATVSFIIAGKDSKALKEQRATLLTEVGTLNDTATTEKREFTEAEQTRWDEIQIQLRNLNKAIEERELLEETESRAAGNKYAQTTKKKENEQRKAYSYTKAIRQFLESNMDGYEKEMHEEGKNEQRSLNLSGSSKALKIPSMILDPYGEQRDMTAGSATAGGNAIQTEYKGFIDILRDALVLARLGADFATGLVGNLSWTKENAYPTATWKAENASLDESNPTFALLTSTPKRLGTFVDVSEQLLLQTSPSINARVQNQLMYAIQKALDIAGINGSGSTPEPLGLLNHPDLNVIAGDTNGKALTWNDITLYDQALGAANVDIDACKWLTNGSVRGALKRTKLDTGSGLFVWAQNENNSLAGSEAVVSNLVPSTLTKGTGTGLSANIRGDFRNIFMGMWGGIEILPNPYTKGKEGIVELIAHVFADVTILNGAAFAASSDVITI